MTASSQPGSIGDEGRQTLEDVLTLHRDAVAGLLRSRALATGDVDAALPEITEAAAGLLSVRRASVWRFDDARTTIECLDLYDARERTHARGVVLTRESAPAYFEAALGERCITANDALTDPRTREFAHGYLDVHGITAMLDAPVLVRGELVGVVCHEPVGSVRAWNAREELLAGTLADFVGMALSAAEHAGIARELRALRDQLEVRVEERTRELIESRENVRELFAASPVALVLTRAADQTVILGNDRASALFGVPLESVRGRHAPDFWVDADDRARVIARIREEGTVDDVEVRLKRLDGTQLWASISVQMISFEGEHAFLFGVHDITAKREAEQTLRELATLDSLTGAFNRRHFFEVARSSIALAERHGSTTCAAMIDVDHFKDVNDTYGHAVGDEVLAMVGRICRLESRETDIVARYGGEEFALLLPETNLETASAVVERIRGVLSGLAVATPKGPVGVTVSAGVAQRRTDEPLDSLLRRADAALYDAKRAGRDRVACG